MTLALSVNETPRSSFSRSESVDEPRHTRAQIILQGNGHLRDRKVARVVDYQGDDGLILTPTHARLLRAPYRDVLSLPSPARFPLHGALDHPRLAVGTRPRLSDDAKPESEHGRAHGAVRREVVIERRRSHVHTARLDIAPERDVRRSAGPTGRRGTICRLPQQLGRSVGQS